MMSLWPRKKQWYHLFLMPLRLVYVVGILIFACGIGVLMCVALWKYESCFSCEELRDSEWGCA